MLFFRCFFPPRTPLRFAEKLLPPPSVAGYRLALAREATPNAC